MLSEPFSFFFFFFLMIRPPPRPPLFPSPPLSRSGLLQHTRHIPISGAASARSRTMREQHQATRLGRHAQIAMDRDLPKWNVDSAFAAFHCSLLIPPDRKSTRLNSSHLVISYAVFC